MKQFSNIADLDQTAPQEQSDLSLHWLVKHFYLTALKCKVTMVTQFGNVLKFSRSIAYHVDPCPIDRII